MNLIIKPIVTEKSLKDAEGGTYTFAVLTSARKREIKREVEELFKVNVLSVYTNIVKSTKTQATRYGRTKKEIRYKKARVHLAKGQKIELLEEKGEKKK